jgi:hypothetical protein
MGPRDELESAWAPGAQLVALSGRPNLVLWAIKISRDRVHFCRPAATSRTSVVEHWQALGCA